MFNLLGSLFGFLCFVSIPSFAQTSLVDLLNKAPSPLHSKITTDEKIFVKSQVTKAAGGTLVLTNAKGDRFTLIIPALALRQDLEITMSAISKIESPELGAIDNPAGVQLEPLGEEFLKPLTLKIELAQPISLSEQIPTASEIDGREMHLATRSLSSSLSTQTAELSLHHFSSYSILSSPSFYEKLKHAVASAKRDRIAAWTAEQIEKDKRGEPVDRSYFERAIREGWETAVKPMLNDIQTCQGGIDAIAVAIGVERQIQILGLNDNITLEPHVLEVAKHKTTYLCIENAKKACYQDHRPFEVRVMALSLARQNALLGDPNNPLVAKIEQLAIKCLKFEIEITSKMTTKTGPDEISLTAKGAAKFSHLDLYGSTTSEGQIQIIDAQAKPKDLNCSLKSLQAAPQELIIHDFGYSVKHDRALGLLIGPLMPGSDAKFSCTSPDGIKFPLKIPSLWPSLFQQIHSQPRNNEYIPQRQAYRIYSWDIFWNEYFANKTYKRTYQGNSSPDEQIIEDTELKAYHKPEKFEP